MQSTKALELYQRAESAKQKALDNAHKLEQRKHREIERMHLRQNCEELVAESYTGGYPTVRLDGKTTVAAAALWTKIKGKIPEGYRLFHRCGNPRCVNLDHLQPLPRSQVMSEVGLNRSVVRGENSGNPKLTAPKVRAIRAAHKGGESVKDIAQEFRTSVGNVRAILRRQTWKHVK